MDERSLSGGPIVTPKAAKAAARAAAKAAKAQARFDVVAAARVAKNAKRNGGTAASTQQASALGARSNNRAARTRNRPATPVGPPPSVEVPSTFPEAPDVETPFDGGNGEGNNHGNGTGPIPEPSSVILFAAGAGLIGLIARKKIA